MLPYFLVDRLMLIVVVMIDDEMRSVRINERQKEMFRFPFIFLVSIFG